ncbi:MAG: calcium-binding protein [Verrucomicrobiales bacterium]
MNKVERDDARENRILNEAVVDAHGPEEQAMGWYYYLEDRMMFPFQAICDRKRPISPLQPGEIVTVRKMAPETECEREMFAEIDWNDQTLAVPLSQLGAPDEFPDDLEETHEALNDWRYWVDRGYQLG